MRDKLRNLKIGAKLIIYIYLLVTPVLLVISFFLVRKNYRESLAQENIQCVNEMDSLVGNLDAQLEQMISLGTYVCINEEILTILRSGEALNDPTVWYKDAPMKMIQDMMALSGQLKTIAIYPENGTLPFLRCMDNSAYLESIDEVKKSEIYDTACSRIGKYILRRAEKADDNIYVNNRSDKIVACREIYDISRRYRLGYLTIGMSVIDFDEACARLLREDNEAVYIFTADGELLSANGIFDEKEVRTRISEAGGGLEDNNICESAGYDIYKSVSDKTGLVAYRFVSASMRDEILKSVLFTNFSLLIGILLSLIPIAYIISYIITRPLKKLTQAMVEFQEGNFDRKVEVESGDEIGMVSDGFNTMVRAIKDLVNSNYVIRLKEKESELDALQAQINPHFLYNALDTFYWKCVEAGNDGIGEDILALSNLFRLVLSRGEGMIRVSDEISLISNYLHIQHERFNNRLSYKIDVDDDIIEERIPKLILQPFVENAVLHGFEKGDEDFSLLIRGRRDGKRLVFVISDSGVGMTQEKIDELMHGAGSAKKADRISGYAIWNVRERLDLLYHGDYKLEITSGVGEGTEVTLELGII